jgi:hypothetical protein
VIAGWFYFDIRCYDLHKAHNFKTEINAEDDEGGFQEKAAAKKGKNEIQG